MLFIIVCSARALSNGYKSRVSPNSENHTAKSKGVRREAKSEEGCSVSFGLLLDVERLFFFHRAGLGAAPASDEARQECLFKLYKKMTAKK